MFLAIALWATIACALEDRCMIPGLCPLPDGLLYEDSVSMQMLGNLRKLGQANPHLIEDVKIMVGWLRERVDFRRHFALCHGTRGGLQ